MITILDQSLPNQQAREAILDRPSAIQATGGQKLAPLDPRLDSLNMRVVFEALGSGSGGIPRLQNAPRRKSQNGEHFCLDPTCFLGPTAMVLRRNHI